MSDRAYSPLSMIVAALVLSLLAGCASSSVPKAALRLEESTLDVRAAQTRTLAAPSEVAILSATIALLQDMEFNVDRIEKPLGVITASKVSDADDRGEKAGLFLLDLMCAMSMSGGCDKLSTAKDEQRIVLTTVVLPSLERSEAYSVRFTIQRVIYDKEDRIRILERVNTPEVYQELFDNLRQSLFIEVSQS